MFTWRFFTCYKTQRKQNGLNLWSTAFNLREARSENLDVLCRADKRASAKQLLMLVECGSGGTAWAKSSIFKCNPKCFIGRKRDSLSLRCTSIFNGAVSERADCTSKPTQNQQNKLPPPFKIKHNT